ncbi:hypothetical protein ABH37_17600 [Mycobacterium haemophilum]|uniref:Uncharacterized protein n=1 Tax=Mycobacterium haemophilum TaxID=29311 RepID=A0A0I9XIQ7_9MYCO|nr:hypothetical protein ABH39_17320 [Mycobacterium haemophilum]KLO34787.1 hypothetical protein ABH38_17780 [Mycobacterium haemophilum]KLO39719.1 hypothetical protein ABH37_17600 [Mycobacterium haemophilum]
MAMRQRSTIDHPVSGARIIPIAVLRQKEVLEQKYRTRPTMRTHSDTQEMKVKEYGAGKCSCVITDITFAMTAHNIPPDMAPVKAARIQSIDSFM